MKLKTKSGLESALSLVEAALKLDPTQKEQAMKAIADIVHAQATKDTRALSKAVDAFARIFLRAGNSN